MLIYVLRSDLFRFPREHDLTIDSQLIAAIAIPARTLHLLDVLLLSSFTLGVDPLRI